MERPGVYGQLQNAQWRALHFKKIKNTALEKWEFAPEKFDDGRLKKQVYFTLDTLDMIVQARSANRSAPQEAPALIIIFDSLMLERSA